MAAPGLFKLSVFLSLLSNLNLGLWPDNAQKSFGVFPPTCNRIECPSFDTVEVGNGFEIRKYNSTVWMSTSPIQDISLVGATRTGFIKLVHCHSPLSFLFFLLSYFFVVHTFNLGLDFCLNFQDS